MPFLLKLSAIGGASILSFSGYRFHQLEVRRTALDKEYREMVNKMEVLQQDRTMGIQEVIEKARYRKRREQTLDIVWTDRLERFREKINELRDCILAMPESLSALQGIVNHYQYMSTAVKDFIGFDVAVATTHNMGLLLPLNIVSTGSSSGYHTAGECGLRAACGTMRQLLPQDDFIDGVCTSVENIKSIEVPKSIDELSRAFQFCMEQLEDARNRALESRDAKPSPSFADLSSSFSTPEASSVESGHNLINHRQNGVFNSSSKVGENSIFLDMMHALLQKMKASERNGNNWRYDPNQEPCKQEEHVSLRRFFKNEMYHLPTHEDIKAAMGYVEKLQNEVRSAPKCDEKVIEGTKQHVSQMKKKGGLCSAEEQSSQIRGEKNIPSMKSNHEVQLALQQLELWKNIAAAFLLEEQARTALSSYHILMTERLTRESISS